MLVLRGLVVDTLTNKARAHCASYVLVQAIAKSYGAASVTFSDEADKKIELYTRSGFDKLPICMAKTQYRSASLSPNCANDLQKDSEHAIPSCKVHKHISG